MKKKERTVHPSKYSLIEVATRQANAHAATDDITRRRIVLHCELSTIDGEVVDLQARLVKTREQRQRVEAQLAGLQAVVEKRC